MDTITHGIVGALVGKALFAGPATPAVAGPPSARTAISSPTAGVAIVGCTLGAIFPDVDIFAGPLAHNPLAIMEWHRNITHSAVILPIWALILTALAIPLARWAKWKSPPLWKLYLAFAAGIASHIFLDLITNFGTMVWSPINYSRPAWDWIFILDLTITGTALVPQMAAWCYRAPDHFLPRALAIWAALTIGVAGAYLLARGAGYGFSPTAAAVVIAIVAVVVFLPAVQGRGFLWTRAAWCRASLAILCVYIAAAAAAHHKALADVQAFAAEEHLQAESLAALPLPPTLTHWVGLVNTKDGVWRTTFYEPSGRRENTRLYADAQSLPFLEKVMQLRDVQTYLWFARFPVWRVERRPDDQTAIEISDVRFFRERDPLATSDPPTRRFSTSRPGRAGFTFEIVFDAQGQMISHGFREPE